MSPDRFVVQQWDGRLFVSNHDGSHHISAARSIALASGAAVLVGGGATVEFVDPLRLAALRAKFNLFYMADEGADDFRPVTGFAAAMDLLSAPWGQLTLPWKFAGNLLFLPVENKWSQAVAHVLRDAGVTDVGELLEESTRRPLPDLRETRRPTGAVPAQRRPRM
jgi:hypothetical protein